MERDFIGLQSYPIATQGRRKAECFVMQLKRPWMFESSLTFRF